MTTFDIEVLISATLIIISYVLIPMKPKLGWLFGVLGNGIYIIPVLTLHKPVMLVISSVFTFLSGWNVWREASKKSTQ